ncbi:MAG: hypothetical protein EBT08_15115 [Betaproteobacteria bacterium]|nr:hypothetical protein [Betaproteobacteria bacterium]
MLIIQRHSKPLIHYCVVVGIFLLSYGLDLVMLILNKIRSMKSLQSLINTALLSFLLILK